MLENIIKWKETKCSKDSRKNWKTTKNVSCKQWTHLIEINKAQQMTLNYSSQL